MPVCRILPDNEGLIVLSFDAQTSKLNIACLPYGKVLRIDKAGKQDRHEYKNRCLHNQPPWSHEVKVRRANIIPK
jgi:hypothetical protein